MSELNYRIKKYFSFTKKEIRFIIIAILISGFIVGFNDHSPKTYLLYWSINLINSILIMTLIILTQLSMQKITSLLAGYKLNFELWWNGLLFGLIMTILSNGYIQILLIGGFSVNMMERFRLGKYRYGINLRTLGWIAISGSLATTFLALLFKLLYSIPIFSSNYLILKAMKISILYTFYTLLPIPNMPGLILMYASRGIYIFITLIILLILFSILFFSIFWSLILSFISASILSILYLWKIEMNL